MEGMRERRSEPRLLCADMVDVEWQDRSGRTRKAAALLEDIAASGACIQFETAIPLGTELKVSCAQGVLEGVVRYCVYREIGYFVGVQFSGSSRWSRQEFEPQHLLDLGEMLAESRKAAGKSEKPD
jgi:hypothetical protein